MDLRWGEADPNNFLAGLHGKNVGINDGEGWVSLVTREGIRVMDWDEETGTHVPGTEELIPWDDIKELYVY